MAEIHFDDTIAAIATPIGEGGISVIRLSGPEAIQIADSVFVSAKETPLKNCDSHTIHFGKVFNQEGHLLDQVLVSLFKAPNSYTGEEVVEISSHGGMVVTRKILERLIAEGIRHAQPGEFTRRAFLNGKMDLTQAEAVLDLIKAKSDLSLEVALRQLSGSLSRKFKRLKDHLMKLYAHMEAYVDFPEEDLEVYQNQEFLKTFESVEKELKRLIASFRRGSFLREGASIVIVGKPNVGKSSLFNALLERDRAIVSEHKGTTRDCLEETIELQGLHGRLLDTAGLTQEVQDSVENMGMERTRKALESAELVLYVVDGSEELTNQDRGVYQEVASGTPIVVVVSKADLPSRLDEKELHNLIGEHERVQVSTVEATGLDDLETKAAKILKETAGDTTSEQITRQRHKDSLKTALKALERAKQAFTQKRSLEFVTIDLKASLDALRELIGEIYSEDLLDVIFAEFCIGK